MSLNQEIYNRLENFKKSQKNFHDHINDFRQKEEENNSRIETLYNNFFEINENINQFLTKDEFNEKLKEYSDSVVEPLLLEIISNMESLSAEVKNLQNKLSLQTPRMSSSNLKSKLISSQNLLNKHKVEREQSQMDLDLKLVDIPQVELINNFSH
jgi:hypothetical protein